MKLTHKHQWRIVAHTPYFSGFICECDAAMTRHMDGSVYYSPHGKGMAYFWRLARKPFNCR